MALPGFEILYSSVAAQLRSADDAVVAAVHWNLISNGLKCCGVGETWPDRQNENHTGSELLPPGWNGGDNVYALRYVDPSSNRTYLMKALAMDGSLMLHLVRCFDEKAESTTLRPRDFVNDDLSTMASAFSNLTELNRAVTSELCNKLIGATQGQGSLNSSTSSTSTNVDDRQQGRSLLEDPCRGPASGGLGYIPPRYPHRPDFSNPFSVGRADLDPLAGGVGGGMFMDPRNFPRPGGSFDPRGNPRGFPPGSIPPGARFDPVGPPGTRPGPDPDHERPPDSYDDMFM